MDGYFDAYFALVLQWTPIPLKKEEWPHSLQDQYHFHSILNFGSSINVRYILKFHKSNVKFIDLRPVATNEKEISRPELGRNQKTSSVFPSTGYLASLLWTSCLERRTFPTKLSPSNKQFGQITCSRLVLADRHVTCRTQSSHLLCHRYRQYCDKFHLTILKTSVTKIDRFRQKSRGFL